MEKLSVKEKIISCFGNINNARNIAKLCGCSAPYVTNVKADYEAFMGEKVQYRTSKKILFNVQKIDKNYYVSVNYIK